MSNRALPDIQPKALVLWVLFVVWCASASGQSTASTTPQISGQELAEAVQELRAQVLVLRTTVADMKS